MDKNSRILVAGHRGLVGSAILRKLDNLGYANIICRTSKELDLCNQAAVEEFFRTEKPEYIFLAAARVGGILANSTRPAEFIYENLMIEANVIRAAWRFGSSKLLFLGSSCIYPKHCPQPIKEEYLLTGELEPTNQPYAVAKIAGIELCHSFNRQYGTNFIACMPTNLYGPNDNFDLDNSHVLPALIRKFHEAKIAGKDTVSVWGTGNPVRDFLHVDDLADACLFLMLHYNSDEIVNIGLGQGVSIRSLAETVMSVVGFEGKIVMDPTKPDGTPVKIVDTSRLNAMGWRPRIGLKEGVDLTYRWYLARLAGTSFPENEAHDERGVKPCLKGDS